MKRIIFFILLVIFIDSCIEPANIDLPEFKYQLVVDGLITNEPGPYTVKLYRSRPLGAGVDLDRLVPEKFSKIELKDDAGNSELLSEVSEGVYVTKADGMRGEIGRSYHIEITLANGKKYESTPELITPVGEVTTIRYQFEPGNKVLPREGDGIRIFADATGVPEHEDLVRLRMSVTYKIKTYPERRRLLVYRPGGQVEVPNPYPCSGYVNRDDKLVQIGECDCCICWVNISDGVPSIADEKYTSNDIFRNEEVGFVPMVIEGPVPIQVFYDNVHVQVQELSLTPDTYLFWKLVQSQKLGLTNLFQPPSAIIKGNIKAINTDEAALGIFWAAGIHSKSLYIDKSTIPYPIEAPFEAEAPCTFPLNSTTQKPSFWQ
jgi:hypothetical protein